MAEIQRTSILNNTANELNLQQGIQALPKNINSLALVYNMNAKYSHVLRNASTTSTNTSAIYTTPADKDFYLTLVTLGFSKDVVSDLVEARISITVESKAQTILSCNTQSVTVDSRTVTLSLPYPLKVDRNTAINLIGAFTVGSCIKTASIAGFVLE